MGHVNGTIVYVFTDRMPQMREYYRKALAVEPQDGGPDWCAFDRQDFDGSLTRIGERYFGLRGPRLHLYTADARPWLAATRARYDAICVPRTTSRHPPLKRRE